MARPGRYTFRDVRGRKNGCMKGVAAINTTQKRLRILRDDEIDALYGRPLFTPEEGLEPTFMSPAAIWRLTERIFT